VVISTHVKPQPDAVGTTPNPSFLDATARRRRLFAVGDMLSVVYDVASVVLLPDISATSDIPADGEGDTLADGERDAEGESDADLEAEGETLADGEMEADGDVAEV
jgi:hypothetical protein